MVTTMATWSWIWVCTKFNRLRRRTSSHIRFRRYVGLHRENESMEIQKYGADGTCTTGVTAARQAGHSVVSLRSVHSRAWDGAMAWR
jgi:hypothetical protein